MKSIEDIKDLFWQDMESHSIKFAEWLSNNTYEKVFYEKKGWLKMCDVENTDDPKVKSYTIKYLYKQFMIDYLCS